MIEFLASNVQNSGYQEAGILAILVLVAILQHLWAYRAGLFDLSLTKTTSAYPTLKIVTQVFLIYIVFTFILPSLLFGFLRGISSIGRFDLEPGALGILAHILSVGSCLIALALFLHSMKLPFGLLIWKRDIKKSYFSDIFMGLCGFLLSYPIVLIAGNFFDWLIQTVFKFISYEQVAVKYLKNTQGNFLEMFVALFTIVLFAPFVEELLFRGFLQTYLRRHLKPQPAILISGFLFALFHYSSSQSLGNISVILTLFILGWYLGVIYERQGSLLSSICFHALFNITSAWRVLLDTAGGS